MFGNLLMGAAWVVIMVIATGVMIEHTERLVGWMKMRMLLLVSVVIGLLTALPELSIMVASSLSGVPQLGFGNLIGANIANLSLVIGGAAVLGKSIPIVGEYKKNELWMTLILAMMPFLLTADGSLGRVDGVILIFGYLLYLNDLIIKGRYKLKQTKMNRLAITKQQRLFSGGKIGDWIALGLAMVVLAIASIKLVEISMVMARSLEASPFWIGLVGVAVATTLPELIVILEAVRRKQASLVLSALFGSVAVNSSLIVGMGALIRPFVFENTVMKGISGVFMVAILGVFWLFTGTKHRLDRWEGTVLVGIYLMFLGIALLVVR